MHEIARFILESFLCSSALPSMDKLKDALGVTLAVLPFNRITHKTTLTSAHTN